MTAQGSTTAARADLISVPMVKPMRPIISQNAAKTSSGVVEISANHRKLPWTARPVAQAEARPMKKAVALAPRPALRRAVRSRRTAATISMSRTQAAASMTIDPWRNSRQNLIGHVLSRTYLASLDDAELLAGY